MTADKKDLDLVEEKLNRAIDLLLTNTQRIDTIQKVVVEGLARSSINYHSANGTREVTIEVSDINSISCRRLFDHVLKQHKEARET